MTNDALTYALIEEKIELYARSVADDMPGIVERLSWLVITVSWLPALLAAQFVRYRAALVFCGTVAVLLSAAMLVCLVCLVRREWPSFRRRHSRLSRELDHDYGQWRELVVAMRRFPQNELARRLRYISARRSSLAYRLGLFTGSVQRLGVLPLLAILYVQFKDWRFGDWQAIGPFHAVGGLLLWMLFLAYVLSWWLVGMGTRWDVYEALLIEATCNE